MIISFKISKLHIVLFIFALVAAFLIATKISGGSSDSQIVEKEVKKIVTVYDIIKNNYVNDVKSEDIFNNAFKGMLNNLDPYSDYFSPDEYREFQISMKGELTGVGMEITMENGMLKVIAPLEDSPAFRAGILAGDHILEIDGESTESFTLSDCFRRIIGKEGTEVTLTLLHQGEDTPQKITVIREKIKIKSVKYAHIINKEENIGYIRITNFQEDTSESFAQEVKNLREKGIKSLIIDLRFNGGGLMIPAVEISNMFIKNGIIVSTKGRAEDSKEIYKAEPKNAVFDGVPLVILINGYTASASEIFSGAIQDHKKGILVGSRTYGKGLVQTLVEIPGDKSAVKLTISKYYTPSGKCLQRQKDKNYGLDPDELVELSTAEEVELLKARSRGDQIDITHDKQLEKAIEKLSLPK
ncbi:MAG: S41 family peptidase [Planctomycetes bacterium]|nr:S41 family peptidase [Planctomycetota bacterium]